MNTQIGIIQTVPQLRAHAASSPVIRSGSVVSVRVLEKTSDGSYVVSLAGQKMQVSSKISLMPGSTFSAKVVVKGNAFSLVLQDDSSVQKNPVISFQNSSQGLSQEAQAFLSSLSLPPDSQSFRIIQFLQQMGMKINPASIKKALQKSKDKSSVSDAQTALLLDSKKLPSDENAVMSVQCGFGGERKDDERKRKKNQDRQSDGEMSDAGQISAEDVKKYFCQVDSCAQEKELGILSAFNSLMPDPSVASKNCRWLVFPFEWNFMNFIGDIRLFFENDLSTLKKMVINCENEMSKKSFSVYFKGKEISSVSFGFLPEPSQRDKDRYEDMLSRVLKESSVASGAFGVEYVPFDEVSGYGREDSEIALVRGEA